MVIFNLFGLAHILLKSLYNNNQISLFLFFPAMKNLMFFTDSFRSTSLFFLFFIFFNKVKKTTKQKTRQMDMKVH